MIYVNPPAAVLVADPPWAFGDSLPGASRGAAKNYATLSMRALTEFPLPPLARDCHLFLWHPASFQVEAVDLAIEWGFKPKAQLIWQKLTRSGKPWFGMGRIVRNSHETCMIATRGKPTVLRKDVRSTFSANVPVDAEGKTIHSAKPNEFYEIVEALCSGPLVELFARKYRVRWYQYGNELDKVV